MSPRPNEERLRPFEDKKKYGSSMKLIDLINKSTHWWYLRKLETEKDMYLL